MINYSYIYVLEFIQVNITRNIRNDAVDANHFITFYLTFVISNTSYQLELMIFSCIDDVLANLFS